MIVFRICKVKSATTAYSGAGGMESSGRWYNKELPIVYAAASMSLAALEYFVHLGRRDVKISLVSVQATISDTLAVENLGVGVLPANWSISPPIDATRDLGTNWCAQGRSAIVRVPSAIIRGEFDYLLNTRHPDFKRMVIANGEPFSLDVRLWK